MAAGSTAANFRTALASWAQAYCMTLLTADLLFINNLLKIPDAHWRSSQIVYLHFVHSLDNPITSPHTTIQQLVTLDLSSSFLSS